jgi:hypothetical protein
LPVVHTKGEVRLPQLAPRAGLDWQLPVSAPAPDEILELTVVDPRQLELWTWTTANFASSHGAASAPVRVQNRGNVIEAGNYQLQFDASTGELAGLKFRGRHIPLRGPQLAAWRRVPDARTFVPAAPAPTLRKLVLAPAGDPGLIARAEYDGALRAVIWRLVDDELSVHYEIDYRGDADMLGVSFAYPESNVLGKRWVGAGPYRIWKNRLAGTQFGLHQTNYSRSTPGVSYEYPEFEGFFGSWAWLEMNTREGLITVENADVPFFGLYRPTPGEKPIIELPDLGWSFLHAVPPIGTKFAHPDVLGPESQATQFTAPIEGDLRIRIAR